MPPKRKRGLRADDAIDEDLTGLQFADATLLFRFVLSPNTGAQPIRRVVGDGDGFIEIARAEQHRHRAEKFLARKRTLHRNIGQHGRLEKEARSRSALATDEDTRARFNSGLHLLFDRFNRLRLGERSHIRLGQQWITHAKLPESLDGKASRIHRRSPCEQ